MTDPDEPAGGEHERTEPLPHLEQREGWTGLQIPQGPIHVAKPADTSFPGALGDASSTGGRGSEDTEQPE
ncbi:MAG TPA: hypothetical protein VLI05_00495 [Candidatus Saccharimonadia bacterium]|nr:hypothetical protein [Candidatus Saccharimonadia bacterium]